MLDFNFIQIVSIHFTLCINFFKGKQFLENFLTTIIYNKNISSSIFQIFTYYKLTKQQQQQQNHFIYKIKQAPILTGLPKLR